MKTTAYSGAILALLFDATAIANVADNAATSPLTNLQLSLHTADPGPSGNQSTSEVSYTSYARVAVSRASGGWTQSTNQVTNAAQISFPKATGVADNTTAEYWGVGSAATGAGVLYYSGPLATLLGPASAVSSTSTLQFGANALASVSVGQKVVFLSAPNGVTPGGIATSTVFFVKSVTGADQMTLSATSGGPLLSITSDGTGYWALLSPLQITQNVQPQIAAGQLTISEF